MTLRLYNFRELFHRTSNIKQPIGPIANYNPSKTTRPVLLRLFLAKGSGQILVHAFRPTTRRNENPFV